MPAYPIPPLLYLASGSVILVLAFLERPVESSVAVAMVLLGLPAWILFQKRREAEAAPKEPS